MANENEEVIDTAEEEEADEAPAEGEAIDWEARAKKLEEKAIAQRAKTKELRNQLAKLTPKQQEEQAPSDKGLDRVDRAVLRTEGIKSQDEIELVEEWKKETGKDVENILSNRMFQGELKDLREKNAAKEAAPSNTKRAGQAPRDEVDYWLAKGELPKDNPELRFKVVNARIAKEKSKNQFSDTPVIS